MTHDALGALPAMALPDGFTARTLREGDEEARRGLRRPHPASASRRALERTEAARTVVTGGTASTPAAAASARAGPGSRRRRTGSSNQPHRAASAPGLIGESGGISVDDNH